ncbi:MAG: hypothetical protein QXJ97_13680 [Desulfurococcaceae archaeon]
MGEGSSRGRSCEHVCKRCGRYLQRVLRSREFSKELSSVLDGKAFESIRKDRKSRQHGTWAI